MPRNGAGTYSLPAGNPVVAGDTIEASWANTTLSDVANELTNSLDRNGNGGMLAPFRLANGSLGAPGIAWLNEPSTGFYRSGAGEQWAVVTGVGVMQFTAGGALVPAGKTLTMNGDISFTTPATSRQSLKAVGYTSTTGSAQLPTGTTAERDGSPVVGSVRFNSTIGTFEGYNGTSWDGLGNSSINEQEFSGNSILTAFTLSAAPTSLAALEVFISGVRQKPTDDYTVSGTTLTFTAAPPTGTDNIFCRWITSIMAGAPADGTVTDAKVAANAAIQSSKLSFLPSGTGAVATTVQTKLRETVSVKDFGAVGDGSDEYTEILAAWTYCLANGKNLYFPAGTYSCGALSFPFGRINGLTPVSLLDCLNITIHGDGPNTVFQTASVTGADVIQINGAKNLHFRNFKTTATISGSSSGSNGVSVTGGYDNITLDYIWMENMPSVDAISFVDGGKALTIQSPIAGQTVLCGTLKATNIFAKGCVYGFGLELDLVAASTMDTSIDIEIVAEDCRDAVIMSAGEATGAIPANWSMGLRVKAQSINSMRDVYAARAHGVDIDCQVITTKTQAARILNYAGVKWMASDTIADVTGLLCTYAHSSRIQIYGNKGTCAYKATVGGATAGLSGLTGATWLSRIYMDLLGTASAAEFGAVNSGGDVTSTCVLVVSNASATPATAHYLPSRNNAILYGAGQVLDKILIRDKIAFTDTNGLDTFGAEVGYDDEAVTIKQKNSSAGAAEVLKILDNSGAVVFSFRNDGFIVSAGRIAATAVSTVLNVMPVYNTSNVLVGYVPVYTSYTP